MIGSDRNVACSYKDIPIDNPASYVAVFEPIDRQDRARYTETRIYFVSKHPRSARLRIGAPPRASVAFRFRVNGIWDRGRGCPETAS